MHIIISAEQLKEELENENLIILDCSTKSNKTGIESKYQNIKIKGARYFDLKNDFSKKKSKFPNTLPNPNQFEINARKIGINKSSYVVLYDDIGIYTSARAWWMFKIMGHKNVSVLNGGLPEWMHKNFPIQKNYSSVYVKGNFKSDFQRNMISDIENVKSNLNNKNSVLIDARTPGRFSGKEEEPRKNLRSGNIPNSINIPFEYVLNAGKFKEKSELKLIFKKVNIESKELIFSCGSGVTACIVYLASELILKNKKSVYDGSWTEWASLVQ